MFREDDAVRGRDRTPRHGRRLFALLRPVRAQSCVINIKAGPGNKLAPVWNAAETERAGVASR
jgi:hypothetical protein